ncbi:hypothetical protein GGI43DRAFT_63350 [Trichoderma evansii]
MQVWGMDFGQVILFVLSVGHATLTFWACEWHWGEDPLYHSLRWLTSQHTGAGLAVAALPAPPPFTYHLYEEQVLAVLRICFSRREGPSYRHASSILCSSSFSVSTIYRLSQLNQWEERPRGGGQPLQGWFAPKQGLEPVSVLK